MICEIIVAMLLTKLVVTYWPEVKKTFCGPKNLFKRYNGGYCVVTGASSGIGKYFAHEFAQRGFNLILIGSERNHATKTWLESKFPSCDVRVIVRDFSHSFDTNFFDPIFQVLDRVDVSVLINNVGSRSGWTCYEDMPSKPIRDTVSVGTMPQIRLLQYCISRFTQRPSRSGVINVTAQCVHNTNFFSLEPTLSLPYLSVYEATNAFGYFHSESVRKELGLRGLDKKIDYITLTPGAVITSNTKHMLDHARMLAIDAPTFSQNVTNMLGVVHGPQNGCFRHTLSGTLGDVAPFIKPGILSKVGRDIASKCESAYKASQQTSVPLFDKQC